MRRLMMVVSTDASWEPSFQVDAVICRISVSERDVYDKNVVFI